MLKEGACPVANTGYIGPFQAIQVYLFGNVSVKGTYTAPSITSALEHDKLEMAENKLKVPGSYIYIMARYPSDKFG